MPRLSGYLLVLQLAYLEKDGRCIPTDFKPPTARGLQQYFARFNFASKIALPGNPLL